MPADVRVPFGLLMEAFGVDATVTIPGGDPIATAGVWILPSTPEFPSNEELGGGYGGNFQRREPKRVLALSRDAVPTVPRGTDVIAPERAGDAPRAWMVDALEHVDADHTRVLVVPGPEIS